MNLNNVYFRRNYSDADCLLRLVKVMINDKITFLSQPQHWKSDIKLQELSGYILFTHHVIIVS
ncbi:MAG: hypothetical protein LBJ75_00725 [Puniceicoccales bacterium]|nr:hypothetical protein [Puniceicoccales bacterium]